MKMYHLVEAESLWALSQRGAVNLPQVKELQDKLRAAGHDPGASDGWYGQKTANAVRAYQEANGLKVDGDAGPQTLAKLGMAGAQQTKAVATPPEKTAAKPAPRKTSTEPKTKTKVEPKTKSKTVPKYDPEKPWAVTPDAVPGQGYEPVKSKKPDIPFYDVGNGTNRRKLRNAINNMGLKTNDKFGYRNMLGKGDGALLFITYINAFGFTKENVRGANRIVDMLQQYLRGSVEMKVAVQDRNGTTLTNGEIFLDPMPSGKK